MQRRPQKFEGFQQSMYIFQCAMSVFYLAFSYALLFTDYFTDSISDKNIRLILGSLLGIYGIYRIYRVIKASINRKKEKEEEE